MKIIIVFFVIILVGMGINACGPIKEFQRNDSYKGPQVSTRETILDPGIQTVVIIASNEGTEIFDLMAPYEIFSLAGHLNVVVLAPEKKVLPLWKGLYVMPQMSFSEFDETGIDPDLIVIPNVADPDNPSIINWLSKHRTQDNYILSICEGARVIAESNLFQGGIITTHHSSLKKISKAYPDLQWMQGQRFVKDGQLLSTSGVSAAVEGSLLALELLMGQEAVTHVIKEIGYPTIDIRIKLDHSSIGLGDILRIIGKTGLTKNQSIGVYVPQQVSELELAAIIDTYNRTFPVRLESLSIEQGPILTRNGLEVWPSASIDSVSFDKLIVPSTSSDIEIKRISDELEENAEVIFFDSSEYVFYGLYNVLRVDHSKAFTKTVFRLLDYNIEAEVSY